MAVPQFEAGNGLNYVLMGTFALAILAGVGATGYFVFLYNREPPVEELANQTGIDPLFYASVSETPPPSPPEPKPVVTPPIKTTHRQTPMMTPQPPAPPRDVFAGVTLQSPDRARIDAINAARNVSGESRYSIVNASDKIGGFTGKNGYFDKPVETEIASASLFLNRVVTADRMITALLIPETISDLAGQITAQIEEDIYGFHGREILIPRGSKAIGGYTPLQRIGDERLIASWHRIVTPEGVNINLKNAKLADVMGRIGGYGEVDRRLSERYGLSIALSTITAAIGYASQIKDPTQNVVASTYATSLGEVSGQILKEQINVQPRLIIPAGSRIMITIAHDVYFPPTSSGTVLVEPYYGEKL